MTDFMQSLTQATTLLMRLRALNEKVKNAEFAHVIADLNMEFADLKLKCAGVVEENVRLKDEIRKLQAVEGEPCPKCRKRTYELESSRRDPVMGDMGALWRKYKCSACGFTEERLTTPGGR
jgi:hypothetical protein